MQRFLDMYKKRYQILLFALVAALFVACTLGLFLLQMKNFSKKSVYMTLEAVSEQHKHEIDSFVSSRKESLHMASLFFDASQPYDEAKIIEKLDFCKKNMGFDYLFYVQLDGSCVNNANEHYQLDQEPFFKEGLKGNSYFYTLNNLLIEENKIFSVVSVPIFDKDGKVGGILGGTNIQATTNEKLFQNVAGNVYSFLLDEHQNIIAFSEDIDGKDKLLAYLKTANISDGIKQVFKIGKENYFAYFDNISQNKWQLVSVIPERKASERYSSVNLWSILASICNFLAFSILIMVMVLIYTTHLNQLKAYAFSDPVTQGISYQKFLDDAEKYINYHRSGALLAVCLDINDFRIFNDLYGFDEGNNLLKLVYKMLGSYIPSGLVCRATTDTFYIITDFVGTEDELLTRRDIFTDSFNAVLEKNKKPYHITFTVGFYRIEESTIGNVALIFEKANHVHNCAKKEGMPCFVYQEKLRQEAIRQKLIENTMHEAFENLEFQMYLQPKYELVTKRLVGSEALVRWESTAKDKKYPDEFIPVFEKTGFIIQIDLYMMECACQLLRHWIDFGIEPVPISVNQSKLLLLNPIYFNVITTTIEKYNLPPQFIEVEITETIMYENAAVLNDLIAKLHMYGIRVAIDDFGSGYSSLVLLRDIKADVLKIDKAFIYKAEKDTVGKKILSSIIQLADTLNMQILAEGVETENQLNMLADLGCHEVQGYLFGKPVPAQTFAQEFRKD